MSSRHWALFDAHGKLKCVIVGPIGPFFFANAKGNGGRVGRVLVTEVTPNATERDERTRTNRRARTWRRLP